MDELKNYLATLRQPDERNALSMSYGSPYLPREETMSRVNALAQAYADYPASFGVDTGKAAEFDAMLRQKYGGSMPGQGAEYLGDPVMPMALPLSLAYGKYANPARNAKSLANFRKEYAFDPRMLFNERVNQTRPALERGRRWLQEEFF